MDTDQIVTFFGDHADTDRLWIVLKRIQIGSGYKKLMSVQSAVDGLCFFNGEGHRVVSL